MALKGAEESAAAAKSAQDQTMERWQFDMFWKMRGIIDTEGIIADCLLSASVSSSRVGSAKGGCHWLHEEIIYQV